MNQVCFLDFLATSGSCCQSRHDPPAPFPRSYDSTIQARKGAPQPSNFILILIVILVLISRFWD